jgi:hypothetical protein
MPEEMINLVLAELAHIGAANLTQVEQYLRSGADLNMAFVERGFALAPSAHETPSRKPSLQDYRPIYTVGTFPQQRSAYGSGSDFKRLGVLVKKIAERQSLRDRYGPEAAAQAVPTLTRPVI